MTQRIELFLVWRQEIFFFSQNESNNRTFFFKNMFSKNWTFFSIWPREILIFFVECDSKNWIVFWMSSKDFF